ncbi:unnamed protein product [Cuscuta europaea]|uniref:Pectate lyase n=1 Tax=Cuscuta europaea TaxID=41803 RepID=A0A9P0Z8B4_CUSEU|nr:unnamed protein product [Cuscuta europaea]
MGGLGINNSSFANLLLNCGAVIIMMVLPMVMGNIFGDLDEAWRRRQLEAREQALNTYEPDPFNVTVAFNREVQKALLWREAVGGNSTISRKLLGTKKYTGPCNATNPIDRCWRCNSNWETNRKRLADCGLGFGRKATGGKYGEFYVVTDHTDNPTVPKPGTLRHAVIQTKPLWIIFQRSMNIRLHQELIVQGNKTIDGRGAQIHISAGAGITLQFVSNVIIHGLYVHDIVQGSGGLVRDASDHIGLRTVSDGDGISLYGASNIWIDHVSMRNCKDGLIDVIEGSTGVTISNSHFTDHNEVMLFGASDSSSVDAIMQITVAFNHFGKRLVQRMPRCRWGYFHVVNNDYTYWNMYAIGGSQHPTIISQGNRFIAPTDRFMKEITKRDYATQAEWSQWTWRSQGDLFMNGAYFVESGDPNFLQKHPKLYDGITPFKGVEVTWLTRFAGALNCKKGQLC